MSVKNFWLILLLLFTIIPCSSEENKDYGEFRSAELRCIIGNNAAMGDHRGGYNGVFRLTSIHQSESIFVPAYAGLNLEHIFDGDTERGPVEQFLEPRHSPMQFKKMDEGTALLHQPPTPHRQMESTTEFHLLDPYYIDVTFRCTPHKDAYQGGAFGLFWASYINAPLNKSTYFLRGNSSLDDPLWQQFCTQYHGHDSTVKSSQDTFNWAFEGEPNNLLYANISKITYAVPFYYGIFRNMVFIVIFDDPERIRFAHSPSGGGRTQKGDDTCPAWDFQFVVPNYEIGKEYQFKYRVVYKPWAGRDDVLKEVSDYLLN